MNTPVSFELAKLLKEKGYRILPDFKSSYPTIAEVVMWLYEKHGIWIFIKQSTARLGFRCFIQRLRILGENDIQNDEVYESPTEAYEAAITYTLTNLL